MKVVKVKGEKEEAAKGSYMTMERKAKVEYRIRILRIPVKSF